MNGYKLTQSYIRKALSLADEVVKVSDMDREMGLSTRSKVMQFVGFVRALEGFLMEEKQYTTKQVQEKPYTTDATESGVTNSLAYGSTEPSELEKIKKRFRVS